MHETQNQVGNQQKQRCILGDPLDPINYVCHVFGNFLRCLNPKPIECWLSGTAIAFKVRTFFTFICHIRPRISDLLHSLQCLKESRVLDLLGFYLANRPGTHIDDMVQGTVNAVFTLFFKQFGTSSEAHDFPTHRKWSFSAWICLPPRKRDISWCPFYCRQEVWRSHRRPCSRLLPLLPYQFQQCTQQHGVTYKYLWQGDRGEASNW